jgi:pyrimidine-nucleoside phosphorylase
MNDPLGYAVGNNLEVIEAINTLNGNGPKDFYDLCINASAELILASGYAKDIDSAINLAKRQIDNKEALNKFAELVKAQYGDESYIYDPSKFAKTPFIIPIISKKSGYVHSIDALTIGNASMKLGAGREKLTDKVNHRVGIVLNKKSGDYVNEGDTLAYIHSIKEENDEVINMIIDSYKIDASEYKQELILGVIK